MRKPTHTHQHHLPSLTGQRWFESPWKQLCFVGDGKHFPESIREPYTKERAVSVMMTPRGIWFRCLAGGSFSSGSRNKRGWRIFHMDPKVWWRKLSGVRGGKEKSIFILIHSSWLSDLRKTKRMHGIRLYEVTKIIDSKRCSRRCSLFEQLLGHWKDLIVLFFGIGYIN